MGYRPLVREVTYGDAWYATKLYGYVKDTSSLMSCKYLQKLGKIGDDCLWDYECPNEVMLRTDEFREWLRLYALDFENFYGKPFADVCEYDELMKIAESSCDKFICWG